jgi:HPt (histidine-containing phosphotransfer) domain-containing protein
MPLMDGLETTKAIRSGKTKVANSKVPIIAMTANALPGDRAGCLAAGMDDYISKPISKQGLAKVLAKWLPVAQAEPPANINAPSQKTNPGPGPSVFDFKLFIDRLEMNEAVAKKALSTFLESIPAVLKELRGEIALGHASAAGILAHRIKGTAAMITGAAMSAVALEMERAGKAGDLGPLNNLLPELDRQFALLQEAIENGSVN